MTHLHRWTTTCITLLLSSVALSAIAQPDPPPSLQRLAWLAGHWSGGSATRTVEEHWTRPAGGTMMAVNRTVAGERTVAFEFLQIRQEGDKLVYIAQPNGGPATRFPLVRLTDEEALFENPEHDFPQRIRYRKLPDGGLLARIEGKLRGQERAMDFPFRRVKE